MQNKPSLWYNKIKFPTADDNKYTRGYAVILGGTDGKLGAAKLASLAALRCGAGLVTICCSTEAFTPYQAWAVSVMIHKNDTVKEFVDFIEDECVKAILIGPGCGVNERTKQIVLEALRLKKPCVLDADAITVFQHNPEELFDNTHHNVVLTPHIGEFSRIFDIDKIDRIKSVIDAAKKAGCTVLLKGGKTIIASLDGKVVVNNNAPPCLATAGSGDVLSGIITGLVTTGILAFDAACIATWVHGEAGKICGTGMISEDLTKAIKDIMKNLEHYGV